ncbi:MAG: CHASE2 domain-containing protein [Vicinamibacterales bacterium]
MPGRLVTIVGAALVALLTATCRPAPLAQLDLSGFDLAVRRQPLVLAAAQTAVIAIDDASLAEVGQWPWPRGRLAELVRRLDAMGATAVAFDMLLSEPDHAGPDGDADLADAMRQAAAIPAFTLAFDEPSASADCEMVSLGVAERHDGDHAPRTGLFRATAAVCPVPLLAAGAGPAGFINAAPDVDGQLRRVPLVAVLGDTIRPALALAAIGGATGGAVLLESRADRSLVLTVGGRRIPLDAQGRLLLRDVHGTRVPLVSAGDVLAGRVDADRVRDRVVFIGTTAAGLRDTVSTPLDRAVPGVVAHADIAETLLGAGAFARPVFAPLIEIASAALAALLVGVAAVWLGWLPSLLAAVTLSAACWWGAGELLALEGLWLSPFWAALGAAVAVVAEGVTTVIRDRRTAEREQERRAAAQRLIIHALTTLTETRDQGTGEHARRTQDYARMLGTELARGRHRDVLSPDRIELVAVLAPLHDIGKVGVPDAVLRKPGALTPDEHAQMRRHPAIGHESLQRAEALAEVHDDEVMGLAKEIVLTHHERWDGSGYPQGLTGDAIPISGRIVALVDAYDALVSDRSYRSAVPHGHAVAAIIESSGTHFDPEVVQAFQAVHERFRERAAQRPAD